jgi:hypothetical protein
MHAGEEREWQTRKKRVDTKLEGQGWKVVPFDPSRPLSLYLAGQYHTILLTLPLVVSMVSTPDGWYVS